MVINDHQQKFAEYIGNILLFSQQNNTNPYLPQKLLYAQLALLRKKYSMLG